MLHHVPHSKDAECNKVLDSAFEVLRKLQTTHPSDFYSPALTCNQVGNK